MSSKGKRPIVVRTLLVGAAGVGKTELNRAFNDTEGTTQFNPNYTTTVGMDLRTKTGRTPTNPPLCYKTYDGDTAGQDRYRQRRYNYYRDCHCMFLVYDISERRSFTAIRGFFEEFLMQYSDFDGASILYCPIVLVGNKTDLRGVPSAAANSCVTREEGVALSKQLKQKLNEVNAKKKELKRRKNMQQFSVLFVETSCLTGTNCTECSRLGEYLGLAYGGHLDKAAVKHCIEAEIPHIHISDGARAFTNATWMSACQTQKEIYWQWMVRRGGAKHRKSNYLDKRVPLFLRRYILSFLPLFERERTWYSDDPEWNRGCGGSMGRTRTRERAIKDDDLKRFNGTTPPPNGAVFRYTPPPQPRKCTIS